MQTYYQPQTVHPDALRARAPGPTAADHDVTPTQRSGIYVLYSTTTVLYVYCVQYSYTVPYVQYSRFSTFVENRHLPRASPFGAQFGRLGRPEAAGDPAHINLMVFSGACSRPFSDSKNRNFVLFPELAPLLSYYTNRPCHPICRLALLPVCRLAHGRRFPPGAAVCHRRKLP